MGLPDVHFTYMAMIIFLIMLALLGVVTAVLPGKVRGQGAEERGFTRFSDLKPENSVSTSTLSDYRVQAGLLIGAVALLLALLASS